MFRDREWNRSITYLAVWVVGEFVFWKLTNIFTFGLIGLLVTFAVMAALIRLGREKPFDPNAPRRSKASREPYDWGESDGDG